MGKVLKVCNLYCGIGGNRKLWKDVEVTAIENKPKIARAYKDFFPDDNVIVTDAHKFLLNHFDQFDFIWSSPPCQSHSKIRNIAGVGRGQNKPIYPDMKLYQEIIFLNQVYHTSGTKFKGKWIVENVIGYYDPLIKPQKIGRHFFWSNFFISQIKLGSDKIDKKIYEMEKYKGFSLNGIKLNHRKDQILRNCVHPKLGLHIFNCAFSEKQETLK